MDESSRSGPRRRPRWRRFLLGLFLFLILAGAGLAVLAKNYGSEFVRDQLETVLSGALEQPVRIGALILRPMSGEFGVANLSIAQGPESKDSMVELGRALVTARMPRLWPPKIVAGIDIADLDLAIEAEPGEAQESEPLEIVLPSTFEVGPLTIQLESARLERGRFSYRDRAEGVEVQVRAIDARLRPEGNGFGGQVSADSLTLRLPEVVESATRLRLNASIDPERIDVKSLELNYDGEVVNVAGAVLQPFNELALDLEVHGTLPLRSLNRYVESEGWPFSGLLVLEGVVRGPIEALNASWDARVPELAAGRVNARDVSVQGQWDSRTLWISELAASLWGGSLQGSLTMVPADLAESQAKLSVTGVSLESLNSVMEEPLELRGELDLDAEATGDPSELGALRARIDVKGRNIVLPDDASTLGAGQVAVAASLKDGVATLSKLSGDWSAADVAASGKVDLEGPFDLRADLTANMRELARALHWKGFDGKAAFDATAKGDWKALRIDGNLRGELVSAGGSEMGKLEVPFGTQERTLRIPRAFVTVGKTRVETRVTANWEGKQRFEGKVRAAPVRMEDLAIFMPPELEPTGRFNLSAEAQGTLASWQGSGNLDAREVSLADVFLNDVRIALSGNEKEISAEQLALVLNGVSVKGKGTWAWSRTGKARLEIGPAQLSRIRGLPQEAGFSGTAKALVEGSIDGDTINAAGELSVAGAGVQELSLGDGGLRFTIDDSRLKANLSFPGLKLSGRAEGRLSSGESIAAELVLDGLTLEPVLTAFAPDLSETLSGEVTVVAQVRVPYADPLKAQGAVRVDPIRLDVAGEGVRNRGPIRLAMEEKTLRLERLNLESDGGGNLSASGTLKQFQNLDLETAVKLPLSLLAGFSPEMTRAGGVLEVNARVSGSAEKPVVTGEGRVTNGSVAFASYPDTLREIEAAFAFTPRGAKLKQLTALLGRGSITGSGQVGIEGFDIGAYRATLVLRELPVAPLDGLRTSWNVDLELLGSGERGIIQGEANLLRGSYSRELSILSLLFQERAASGGGSAGEPTEFDMVLRVRVNLNDNFRVRTPLARLRVGGSVMVEGPVTDPVLFGSVRVREGTITFQKRRFDLKRAEVNFVDPRQIDPTLDIEATSTIRQYDVTLQLSGRPQDLTITLASDPSLPEEDLLSLVAFGVTREQFGRSAPGVLAGQAAQLIADDLFGSGSVLDNIDVDTQGDDGSVTVGARLSEDTTVSFARGTGTNGKGKIRVEHQLLGPLLIAGGRDLEGGFETDVVLRFRFR